MTVSLFVSAILVLLLLSGAQGPAPSTSADTALLDAAQQNDVQAVTRALQQGANVNAKTRYSATALTLGAMNGNLEVVRLLLERGADLAVRDTFYGMTPLTAAMTNGRMEVITHLVEKGAPGAVDVLPMAIQRKNIPLLTAVLSRTDVPDKIVAATHALAVKPGNTEMATAVQASMTARKVASNLIVALPASALQSFAATYVQQPTGQAVTVAVKDDQLTMTQGPGVVMLFPTSESSFISPERPTA